MRSSVVLPCELLLQKTEKHTYRFPFMCMGLLGFRERTLSWLSLSKEARPLEDATYSIRRASVSSRCVLCVQVNASGWTKTQA